MITQYEVEWTPEKTQQFWDLWCSQNGERGAYFSKHRRDSILRFVERKGIHLVRGHLLDFGCGPGYLLERMVRRNPKSDGVDFSARSIDLARTRLSRMPVQPVIDCINELPTKMPSERYSVVFLVETIEHLLDNQLHDTLSEINRLTVPDGTIVVTTPNDEDLDSKKVICPECGCVYHQKQHVRSWDKDTLTRVMREYGFEKRWCGPTFLREQTLPSLLRGIALRVLRMKLPHLVYIGRKRASE